MCHGFRVGREKTNEAVVKGGPSIIVIHHGHHSTVATGEFRVERVARIAGAVSRLWCGVGLLHEVNQRRASEVSGCLRVGVNGRKVRRIVQIHVVVDRYIVSLCLIDRGAVQRDESGHTVKSCHMPA